MLVQIAQICPLTKTFVLRWKKTSWGETMNHSVEQEQLKNVNRAQAKFIDGPKIKLTRKCSYKLVLTWGLHNIFQREWRMKTTPKYARLQPYTSPLLCSNDYFLWLFRLWKLKSQTFRHTDRLNYAPRWHNEINAQLRNHKLGKCHHSRNICCVIEFSCEAFLVTTPPLPYLPPEVTQRLLEFAADLHIHLGCFSCMKCCYSLASYLKECLWGEHWLLV